jgi:glutaredoxin
VHVKDKNIIIMKGKIIVQSFLGNLDRKIVKGIVILCMNLSVVGTDILGVGLVQAGSLYKWIDENGNVIYQDTPPPSSVEYEEQNFTDPDEVLKQEVSPGLESAAAENPISLYSIPNCDACDLVRLYLDKRALPFAEKSVENNLLVQQELKSLAGQLNVPVLVVGDEIIDGYSKSAMRKVLLEKHYPIDQLEKNSSTTASSGTKLQAQSGNTDSSEEGEFDPLAEIKAFENQILLDEFSGNSKKLDPISEIQAGSD